MIDTVRELKTGEPIESSQFTLLAQILEDRALVIPNKDCHPDIFRKDVAVAHALMEVAKALRELDEARL